MRFNAAKCELLTITRKRTPSVYSYTVDGTEIQRSSRHKYLGVTISSDLRWNTHIDIIRKKALRTLGVIRRTLASCPQEVKTQAYQSLVRPGLEYAAAAWNPYTKCNVKALEHVQRRAARVVCRDYSPHTSATGLVHKLGWVSLEARRLSIQATLFYKIHHALVLVPFPTDIQFQQSRTRAAHQHRYQQLSARTEPYRNSFFVRMIPVWNLLPATAVEAATVAAFRTAAFPQLMKLASQP